MLSWKNLGVATIGMSVLALLGCSAEGDKSSSPEMVAGRSSSDLSTTQIREVSSGAKSGTLAGSEETRSKSAAARKLVYTGDVRIEVSDIDEMEKALTRKVDQLGGFVGSVQESRRDQKQRSGQWTIRVPVEQFPVLLEWLDATYYVVDKTVRSRDVTEEFVDLHSRLVNKRKTELRLTEHLANSTSKLSEILEMEKEIERVREDIERIEGRLNLLKDQADLSTLTIRVESRSTFVAVQSPTMVGTLASAFYRSWLTIGTVLFRLLVFLVAILPYAIMIAAIAFVAFAVTGQSPMRIFKRWRE